MRLIITEKDPKEFKDYVAQHTISWDVYPTPWGNVIIAETALGVCLLEFIDSETVETALLQKQWLRRWRFAPQSLKQEKSKARSAWGASSDKTSLKVLLAGTDFQRSVWKAISAIPKGKTIAYRELAQKIDKPRAVRAVGNAVGKNPLSLLIPCHRILRADGSLGGYRWCVKRKEMILAEEGYFIA